MKSLSSSRREVLVDCFHVFPYHIGYLLPGSAVLQHSATSLNNPFQHQSGLPTSNFFHNYQYIKWLNYESIYSTIDLFAL